MSKRSWTSLAVGVSSVIACSDPAGLATRAGRSLGAPSNASFALVKQPIAGTISFAGAGTLGEFRVTPGGQCFFLNFPVTIQFDGDVVGPVTINEDERAPCDLSHLTGSGPFAGQVTWNGMSGTIAGQWTTNCTADASQPLGLSCGGTMNARGSGGLEGVQFHFKWGPGWYPFPYTGTAFSE